MKIDQLLGIFKKHEITLWCENGKLKYRAPKGALTQELKDLLIENKENIIAGLESSHHPDQKIYPLSFNQQSLWFVHQFDPTAPAYNIGAACRISSFVDVNTARSALARVVQKHEVLRTSYFLTQEDNSVKQRINDVIDSTFEHIDVSDQTDEEIKAHVKLYYQQPLNLETGPVMRACLFSQGPENHILLFVIHHIACDLWSLNIVLNDFFRFYDSELKGLKAEETPVIPYVDFVNEQSASMKGLEGESLLNFWINKLGDFEKTLELPLDYERPQIQKLVGASYFFEIQGDTYQVLKQYAKNQKTTLACLMLSFFNLVLHKYSGQNDIFVGMPVASRKKRKYHQTCGYFVNPIVIPSRLNAAQSFESYLADISQSMFECIEHQEYPFSLLVENLIQNRETSRSPGFQVMFNMLGINALGTASHFLCEPDGTAEKIGSLTVSPYPIPQQEGQYEMTLEFLDSDKGLQGVLKYNTDLFKERTIVGFVDNYLKVVEIITSESASDHSNDAILNTISVSKKSLKPLVLAGTFTTELVDDVLSFWLDTLDLDLKVEFAPYNQIFQLLLDPESALSKNTEGINILFLRIQDWLRDKLHEQDSIQPPDAEQIETLKTNIQDFVNILSSCVQSSDHTFIVCICPASRKLLSINEWSQIIHEQQARLTEELELLNSVYTVTPDEIYSFYPVSDYDEPLTDKIAHIPYTQAYFSAIGTMVARKIYALESAKYKVVAVDCDNTLWDGVVGEDGVLGVTIDDGKRWFQQFLIDLYKTGRVICLCSKNNEADVKDVFERHPDMILKWEHIAGYAINWSPKSHNIQALAQDLNLGIDSFIFIDDNPIECEEMKLQCPEVLTIQMPQADKEAIADLFMHIWSFDILKTTAEDIRRSEFYVKDRERKDLQKTTIDYAEFISGLGLDIQIQPMQSEQLNRVAQITQRTNQFNSTKIVRSENDIKKIETDPKAHVHTVTLKDRFGDYGLVGVIISALKEDSLEVDSFMLSCRALGRGVEHRMLAFAGQLAVNEKVDYVDLLYRPTDRNLPAVSFLDSVAKDYVTRIGSEIVYRMPSDIAASTTFIPLSPESGQKSTQKKATRKSSKANKATKHKDYQQLIFDIARNLNSTDAIETYLNKQASSVGSSDTERDLSDLDIKSILTSIYAKVLKRDDINPDDNFFDIGGKSILIPLIVLELKKSYDITISIVDVLRYPTITALASHLRGQTASQSPDNFSREPVRSTIGFEDRALGADGNQDVAIVGMAGRFPGADSIQEFWHNVVNGKETISTFSDQECIESGAPPELLEHPEFVKRQGVVEGPDMFDAKFFSYSPIEAQYIDPQQRIFLECTWHALEHAGYHPEDNNIRIGVFAGSGMNYYLMKNILGNSKLMEDVINPMTFFGNDKDFLTTRVSYKLNLKGPSLDVQTACSTSLVAVYLACQALLANQCDMAICGGVSLQTPRMKGYVYQEGHILSKDGACRAFDAEASGTVFGEGAGVLVLKRLNEATEDRDTVHAVIKGIAVNNDGSNKVGFTAPSVEGQTAVVKEAFGRAGIVPADVSYIESHGTGTQLGDPIEIAALTNVFGRRQSQERTCAVGSVKPNIGHLDAAAGVTGVIKAALALENSMIPPLIHLKKENPILEIDKTPFYFPTQSQKWITDGKMRVAGVSSFGIGGTNAHAVLSEPPTMETEVSKQPHFILLTTAKTDSALRNVVQNLSRHIATDENINLADAAYTLMVGRKHHNYRGFVICDEKDSAVKALDSLVETSEYDKIDRSQEGKIVFMFSGQGTQYPQMGRELYEKLPKFREVFNRCADILLPIMELDIREIIYSDTTGIERQTEMLNETYITQPALFCVEYAYAKFLIACGITPSIMIGHSIGEYVAACISGVFTLEEALKIVAKRGRLMQEQPSGAMLAVSLSEKEINEYLSGNISIAAVNSPKQCVLSGPIDEIDQIQRVLESCSPKIPHGRLKTSHAFHSPMMGPAAKLLQAEVGKCQLRKPGIPYMSNVTGQLITDQQAMDPQYYAKHVVQAVRYSDGVNALLSESNTINIEIGPGLVLTSLFRQHLKPTDDIVLVPSIRHRDQKTSDFAFMLKTLGTIWSEGAAVDWARLFDDEKRARIPLPVYPFERQSFWIHREAPFAGEAATSSIPSVSSGAVATDANPAGAPDIQEKASAEKKSTKHGGTQTDVSSSLTNIWRSVLGYKFVKPEDNFFELGGSSLMAVALFDKIETTFNIRLPLATLYEAPTIKEMSMLLRSEDYVPSWNSLVVINKGKKDRPPLFCVHAEGGNVLEYRLLSKYLGDDQPFYGIQAKGLQGESVVEDSIEEMAASYIKELKTVQANGPYFIGGYCLGGLVAYEIAQQLLQEGEQVGLLLLISNATPDQMRRTVPRLTKSRKFFFRLLERFELEVDNLKGLTFKQKKNHISDRIIRLRLNLQTGLEEFVDGVFSKIGVQYRFHSRAYILKKSVEHTNLAYAIYDPKPTPCPIHLVQVTRPLRERELVLDEYWGWDVYAQNGIDTYLVEAFHKNLLRNRHVQELAKVVGRLLINAYDETGKQ